MRPADEVQPDSITRAAKLALAIEVAVQVAPKCKSLIQVARLVNEELDLDWTDAKWRGIWKDKPQERFDVEQLLGLDARAIVKAITVAGDCKFVVAGDFHVPYHDAQAIELMCKVIKWWQPTIGIINGDLNDFPGLSSKFDPHPTRATRAQSEVDTAKRDVLIPFGVAMGKGRKIVLPGNHDDRLEIMLWKQPDLFSLRATSLPELWELARFGYEYASDCVLFDDLLEVVHGNKVASEAGYSVKGELLKRHWGISVIMNHIHRRGSTSARVGDHWVYGNENPCMCSLEPPYMKRANWSLGFTLGEKRGHNVNIIPVDIFADYTCTVAGRWFGLN